MEVFGTLAAAGSLLKIAYTIGERCYHAAEKLEGLEQARLSSSYQITSLRIVYKALSSNLHKYNCDVEENLSKSDKDAIRDILNDIARTTDNCEQIVTKLRKALQRKSNKTDLDSCREELNSSLNVIRTLQTAFVSHITLETCRKLSVGRSNDREEGVLSRQATSSSARTLVQSPSRPPVTRVSTALSSESASSSTNSTRTLRFLEGNRHLQSAVQEKNIPWLQRFIGEEKKESEVESRKASALLTACRHRQTELVRWLLSSHASIDITDMNGLGVMHSTIGQTGTVVESRLLEIVAILKLLVQHNARVTATEDSKQRRQPLHFCAISSNYSAAKYVLSVDPRVVNHTDGNKMTALYHACDQPSPNESLVKLLLERKATFGKRSRPKLGDAPRLQNIRGILDREEKKRRLTE